MEVFRDDNLAAGAAVNTYATAVGAEDGSTSFTVDPMMLVDGDNVLAVEVHQASHDSSDISFDFQLTALLVPGPSSVVGRHVFYNNSAFDGDDPLANAADDAAIATDKSALSAGEPATFENYTNFDGGINGIIVDIDRMGRTGSMTVADFGFRVGNNDDPSTWESAPGISGDAFRSGEGEGGSDRVMIVWPDGVIANQWLEVTVLANDNTGLEADEVFYFGNAVGDTGDSPFFAIVDDVDFDAIGANHADSAGIENVFDINRDGRVDPTDAVIVRTNYTDGGTPMAMLWSPVPEPSTFVLLAFGLFGLSTFRRRRSGNTKGHTEPAPAASRSCFVLPLLLICNAAATASAVTITEPLGPNWFFQPPKNLGPVINTSDYESSPTISFDGLELIFGSDRPGSQNNGRDLWQSTRASLDAPWTEPTVLGLNLNSSLKESGPDLSSDGITLFFYRQTLSGEYESQDLYQSTRSTPTSPWGTAVPTWDVNSGNSESSPSISADGLTLIFDSTRLPGLGNYDLWQATRPSTDAPWNSPSNMNAPFNTEYGDGTPSLSADGLTLIWASWRPGSNGQSDIWLSSRETASMPWSTPRRLSAAVNTEFDDLSPEFSADGRTVFLNSDRSGGHGDHDIWLTTALPAEAYTRFSETPIGTRNYNGSPSG